MIPISEKDSTAVRFIAEAGVNHNGDLEMAYRMIAVAAKASADYVKFQTFSADRLVTRDTAKASYQKRNTGTKESQYEMLKALELDLEAHKKLIEVCNNEGVRFLSTGFDAEAIDLLDDLGVEVFKIPSGELTNVPYLRHVARKGKEILLSTGMADLAEVAWAIQCLENDGTPRSRICLMHCTTDYPAAYSDVNLLAMRSMADAHGVVSGYSDHTLGTEVSIAAVALGASVIEKHFTLDRSLPGPDHRASLEPNELEGLIQAIRNIESALGDGVKRPTTAELENRKVARKSIVAARDIAQNEKFTENNLASRRPETGISALHWDQVVGCRAIRSFRAGEQIEIR